MSVDRVADWKEFSDHMEKYIREQTTEKYGIDKAGNNFDLMAITRSPVICVWQILKYSLRIWNNHMKEKDIEKIAHYACLSWCFSKGEIIKHKR
jgi:hypothetical protein